MMDFNIGETRIIYEHGNDRIIDKGGFVMIYSNDILYFPRKSIFMLLPEYNDDYMNYWIEKATETGLAKNRFDEINAPFQKVLTRIFSYEEFLFNVEDVVYVINGTDNWAKLLERVNNGFHIKV